MQGFPRRRPNLLERLEEVDRQQQVIMHQIELIRRENLVTNTLLIKLMSSILESNKVVLESKRQQPPLPSPLGLPSMDEL